MTTASPPAPGQLGGHLVHGLLDGEVAAVAHVPG